MRILIAEDDQVLADGLLRTLRKGGYAVDQVGSGTEADAARQDCPALHVRSPSCCVTISKPGPRRVVPRGVPPGGR